MGANFDSFTSKAKNQAELVAQYKQYCENCAHEDGNSYSGRLNMKSGLDIYHDKVFNSENEAYEFVSDKAEKWGNAIAVRFKSFKVEPSKKVQAIRDKIRMAQNEAWEVKRIVNETTTKKIKAKSFVTCGGCKSKVNTVHVSNVACPVCRQSLASATDLKKIQRTEEKIKKLQEQLSAEIKKIEEKAAAKSNTYEWFVGGSCSS